MGLCHFFVEKSNQKLWLEELVPPVGFTQTAPSQIRYFLFNASRAPN